MYFSSLSLCISRRTITPQISLWDIYSALKYIVQKVSAPKAKYLTHPQMCELDSLIYFESGVPANSIIYALIK